MLNPGRLAALPRLRPAALIVAIAVAVRLLAVASAWDLEPKIGDELHYEQIARNLVSGQGFAQWGQPTSMRPPLYPALIASVWLVTGIDDHTAVRLAQVLFGALGAWAAYAIGRRLYNARVALWAGMIAALYPTLVVSTVFLLTEVTFTALLLLFVYAVLEVLRTGRTAPAVAAGLTLGLAALTRSVMWPFVLVAAAMLLVFVRESLTRRAIVALVLVLGYVVVVGPWAYRNTRLQQTITVVDTMGGLNLLMGNYEHTPEDRMWAAVELSETPLGWERGMPLHAADGSDWTQGKKDKWAQRRAFAYMAANPGTTLRRSVLKFADFWGLEREVIAGVARGLFPVPSVVAILAAVAITFSWVSLAVLAAMGACLAPPSDGRHHVVVLAVILFMCAVHSVVFAHSRYHLPLVPLLGLYAAAAWDQRAWRQLVRPAVPSVLACVLVAGLAVIWVREVLVRDADHIRTFVEAMR